MRVAVALVLLVATTAHADDEPLDPGASSANKPGFVTPSMLTGDWGGARTELFDAGVSILPSYAIETFGAPGLDGDWTAVAGLAALEVDLDLSLLIDRRFGRLYAQGFAIHGNGLTERLNEVFGVSNNVAPPDVRLFEAWIEQPFGPLTVRAGLLSADQEFVISEQSSALIDATFGIITMFSVNIIGPVYPVAGLGASARYESEAVTVRAAVYDGEQINSHGIPTELGDAALALGEVAAGSWKLGGWHHTERGDAVYAIVDRQLDDRLGMFVRAAVASEGPVTHYADAGIRIVPSSHRVDDVVSLGLAFADGDQGAQTLVEASYQVALTGWLVLQPDAQLLFRREGTAGVVGARVLVTF
jgi:porin